MFSRKRRLKKLQYFFFSAENNEAYCVVKRGECLGSEKKVHMQGIPIGSTALSKLDEEKIRTGILLKVDVILVPGVRNSLFFDHVRKFVGKSSIEYLRSVNDIAALIFLFFCI